MSDLNRRHLLLGSATTLVGGAVVPLITTAPAWADTAIPLDESKLTPLPGKLSPEYSFDVGYDTCTVARYNAGSIGVTWTRRGSTVLQQSRFDYSSNSSTPTYTTEVANIRGRRLVVPPFNPQQGIFGAASRSERFRVNVNGFGYIVYDNGNGQTRVRFQVAGSGGRVHTGEMIRGGRGTAASLLDTFIDQAGTLNQQYTQYRNAVGQQAALGGVSLGAALAALCIGGAVPLALLGIAVAFSAASVNTVATIRDRQATYITTQNGMITTFYRLSEALGFGTPDIAMYDVGGLRYNRMRSELRTTPTYPLLAAGSHP